MNKLLEVANEMQNYDEENIVYSVLNESNSSISLFSICFISFIGIIYLILGALSILQISAVETRTINIVESNGRRIRPYFLKIFTTSLVLRLFYIVSILVLCFDPLFMATMGIKRFELLRIYDHIVGTVLLTSYSIIMCLWSSILTKSEGNRILKSIQIPLIISMNVLMYVFSGLYLLIILKKEIIIKIEIIIYMFTGILYSLYSYFWLHLGFELVKQINKRHNVYSELGESLINKNTLNSGLLNIDNYNFNKNINDKSAGHIEISPKYNFNIYSETTSSSSPNLSSCRFFYNYIYKSTVIDLKGKIMLITLICPLSLIILSASYIIDGISLACNCIKSNAEDITINNNIYMSSYRLEFDSIYLLITEIVPSMAIIYGFWNNKTQYNNLRHQADENDTSNNNDNNTSGRNVNNKGVLKYTQFSFEKVFGYKDNKNNNSTSLNGIKTERYYYNVGKY
ncbi:hypothetical protein FG379_003517 [Cryptosporidium bovis]|uniref:uncharacterized protein n=1 Tax=Cryptosporidium bovis TaxID=310047 RepID=UPI00351A012E|nr:hypothetical protein FG379_003517 [Cryptosporidium bovis]